jgi:hypothetical protein
MHGTLELTRQAAARRRWTRATIVALAAAGLAGIVAGATLVYTRLGNDLSVFLRFTPPKDCG